MHLHHTRTIVLIRIAIVACVLLSVAAITLGAYAQFAHYYAQRFYPGVRVANFSVSGMTYQQALEFFDAKTEQLETEGVAVFYDADDDGVADTEVQLTSTIVPLEAGENTRQLYAFNMNKSLDEAYAVGHTGDWKQRTREQWLAWSHGYRVAPLLTFDAKTVRGIIADAFAVYETPATNADILITNVSAPIEILPEKNGTTFPAKQIVKQVKQQLQTLDASPIAVRLEIESPKVTTAQIKTHIPTINAYMDRMPLALEWEGTRWEFDQATAASWLSFTSANALGTLVVSPERLETSLTVINETVFVKGQEARWQVEKNPDGTLKSVNEIQPAKAGREVDSVATAADITSWLATYSQQGADLTNLAPIPVIVKDSAPQFTAENIQKEAVSDLLGIGHTNLRGSSANRRSNISRGMSLIHGLLLAPGESFSTLKALKPFTATNGYVAELVIKGNRTTPEIGGGLCQIGTTLFRATMNAGLDVVDRRNHSFAVPYYFDERNGQPGTDATIYDPAPDYKFKNDMNGYVLVQAFISGDDVYVELWGKTDGRVGSFSAPKTYDWISPPATKEIPTTELAPGQKKCTELPHAGVTSDFTYAVKYGDGTPHEEVFHSVYRPWQAVCLVGTTPTTTTAPAQSSTNTSTNKNTNSAKPKIE